MAFASRPNFSGARDGSRRARFSGVWTRADCPAPKAHKTSATPEPKKGAALPLTYVKILLDDWIEQRAKLPSAKKRYDRSRAGCWRGSEPRRFGRCCVAARSRGGEVSFFRNATPGA